MISSIRLAILLTAALSGLAAGWFVNGLIWEGRSDKLLAKQKTLLLGQCKDSITNLKDTNDDLHKNLSDIRNRYYAALRLQPVCLRVDSGLADH